MKKWILVASGFSLCTLNVFGMKYTANRVSSSQSRMSSVVSNIPTSTVHTKRDSTSKPKLSDGNGLRSISTSSVHTKKDSTSKSKSSSGNAHSNVPIPKKRDGSKLSEATIKDQQKEEKIKNLQKEIDEYKKEIENLRKEIENLREELCNCRLECGEQSELLEEALKELDCSQTEGLTLVRVFEEYQKLNEEIDRLQTFNRILSDEYKQLEEDLGKSQAQRFDLEKKIQKLEENAESLRERYRRNISKQKDLISTTVCLIFNFIEGVRADMKKSRTSSPLDKYFVIQLLSRIGDLEKSLATGSFKDQLFYSGLCHDSLAGLFDDWVNGTLHKHIATPKNKDWVNGETPKNKELVLFKPSLISKDAFLCMDMLSNTTLNLLMENVNGSIEPVVLLNSVLKDVNSARSWMIKANGIINENQKQLERLTAENSKLLKESGSSAAELAILKIENESLKLGNNLQKSSIDLLKNNLSINEKIMANFLKEAKKFSRWFSDDHKRQVNNATTIQSRMLAYVEGVLDATNRQFIEQERTKKELSETQKELCNVKEEIASLKEIFVDSIKKADVRCLEYDKIIKKKDEQIEESNNEKSKIIEEKDKEIANSKEVIKYQKGIIEKNNSEINKAISIINTKNNNDRKSSSDNSFLVGKDCIYTGGIKEIKGKNGTACVADGEGTLKRKPWLAYFKAYFVDDIFDPNNLVEVKVGPGRNPFTSQLKVKDKKVKGFISINDVASAVDHRVTEKAVALYKKRFQSNVPNSGAILSEDLHYEGGLMNGEPHGNGKKLSLSTGEIQEGTFMNGKFIE